MVSRADLSDWGTPNQDPCAVGADGRTVADRLELLKECAGMQFKQGNNSMAKQMYSEAIRMAPQAHTLYANRSAVSCASKEYLEALADANRCIELMPGWPKGYARRGAALHGLHRWREAISSYEHGLKMEPGLGILEQGIDDVRRRMARAGGEWLSLGDRRVRDKMNCQDEELIKCPVGMCAAPSKGVAVLDIGHNRVTIFDASFRDVRQTFNTWQETNRVGLFAEPRAIACDDEHLYVADGASCCVLKVSIANAKLVAKLGRSGAQLGEFDMPTGIAMVNTSAIDWGVDKAGERLPAVERMLYVADSKNRRVVAVDAETLQARFAFGQWGTGDGEMMGPHGLAASPSMIAVADEGNKRVALFTLKGEFLRNVGSEGTGLGQFKQKPKSVGLTDEHLFVVEDKEPKMPRATPPPHAPRSTAPRRPAP